MDPHDARVALGARLGREAARREISHERAAEIIGVSQATFSRWVAGQNLPVSAYWTKIGRFLSVPREQVIAWIREGREETSDLARIERRLETIEGRLERLTRALEDR